MSTRVGELRALLPVLVVGSGLIAVGYYFGRNVPVPVAYEIWQGTNPVQTVIAIDCGWAPFRNSDGYAYRKFTCYGVDGLSWPIGDDASWWLVSSGVTDRYRHYLLGESELSDVRR